MIRTIILPNTLYPLTHATRSSLSFMKGFTQRTILTPQTHFGLAHRIEFLFYSNAPKLILQKKINQHLRQVT